MRRGRKEASRRNACARTYPLGKMVGPLLGRDPRERRIVNVDGQAIGSNVINIISLDCRFQMKSLAVAAHSACNSI
ncbi:hypothetical protein BDA96_01G234600 [Sorghum bicolor]|uniref:Uncharacterized protein n=2 Tax=Sorghum bicolor TaxID=4558 RepID=A0A921RZQ0_SORBI|nr:hypothetical protein BDA96_01G234600 [Sorghum bicolor]OQU91638.1 hypothetical protein SORBI_3001G220250 [Sorghum bicolor]